MAEVLVRGPGVEQRISLEGGTVSVGRERFNDIVVPDAKASRKHAQVEKIGEDQWMITDLGSSNGTFLRGERVSQVLIHENDVFTIGAISMIFTGVEASLSDDRMPTTMATAEELNAKMAVMQARREREAQVPTAPTPSVAVAPPAPAPRVAPPAPRVAPPAPAMQQGQGGETMDLRAMSAGQAPPAPAAPQGMETMDLRAMPEAQAAPSSVSAPAPAAPPPAPPVPEFGTDRTVDLAAMHASNRPSARPPMTQPPPGKPAQTKTDPEDLDEHEGTVAIMADQAKAGVSMFNAAPAPTSGGLSNPFAAGAPPPVPSRMASPSGLPSMSPPPGGRPPGSGGGRGIDALLQGGFEVKGTEYISKGWEVMKPHIGVMIGLTVVTVVVGIILGVILSLVFRVGGDQLAMMQGGFSAGLMGRMMAKRIVMNLVISIVTTPFAIALLLAGADAVRGRTPSFSAIGEGFKHMVPVVIYTLITGFLTALGLVFCILPGIFLAVCFNRAFGTYLIIDRGMSFSDALSTTFKITLKNWVGFFVFLLLLFLLNVAGAIACLVGLLFTIPLSVCALAVMYDELVGFQS